MSDNLEFNCNETINYLGCRSSNCSLRRTEIKHQIRQNIRADVDDGKLYELRLKKCSVFRIWIELHYQGLYHLDRIYLKRFFQLKNWDYKYIHKIQVCYSLVVGQHQVTWWEADVITLFGGHCWEKISWSSYILWWAYSHWPGSQRWGVGSCFDRSVCSDNVVLIQLVFYSRLL